MSWPLGQLLGMSWPLGVFLVLFCVLTLLIFVCLYCTLCFLPKKLTNKFVLCADFVNICVSILNISTKLENVFMKHYAPNHMPDPKGEWTLKENNSELHHEKYSKVNQFI